MRICICCFAVMLAACAAGSSATGGTDWIDASSPSDAMATAVDAATKAPVPPPSHTKDSTWMNMLSGPDAGGSSMNGDTGAGSGGASAARDAGATPPMHQPPAASGSGGHDSSHDGTVTPPPDTTPPLASGPCVDAKRLWFDDFETGDYSRWTSQTYDNQWGDNCQSTAISTESAHSPTHSNRSEIVCPYPADSVQRGYGGIQMSGDNVVPAFTNQGVGLDAPNGVVTVMWMRLDSPTVFQNGTWVNFWTASASCDWSDEVLTLGIEDNSGKLAAAHYSAGGGTRTFEPGAQALPRGQWTRITVYVNYHDGVMHVWQDGKSLESVTFNRALKTICQFHWGLYASSDNSNIVLFEDDKSLWKLNQPWTDFTREPYFGGDVQTCNN